MNKEELKSDLRALGITLKSNKISKSSIEKVLATNASVQTLIRSLYSVLGNKRYLHDLEDLLNEKFAELTSFEDETIMYLARDLKRLKS